MVFFCTRFTCKKFVICIKAIFTIKFNFLLTIALIAGIYLFFGKVEISNTLNGVVEGSPADNAGIIADDKIVGTNGIFLFLNTLKNAINNKQKGKSK